jgi:hypothetical protein
VVLVAAAMEAQHQPAHLQPVVVQGQPTRVAAAAAQITRAAQVAMAVQASLLSGTRPDMAHFAELRPDGIVIRVVQVNDSDIEGGIFPASEPIGQNYLVQHVGESIWKQCSYSGSFRNMFPGPGCKYDDDSNRFFDPYRVEIPPALLTPVVQLPLGDDSP